VQYFTVLKQDFVKNTDFLVGCNAYNYTQLGAKLDLKAGMSCKICVFYPSVFDKYCNLKVTLHLCTMKHHPRITYLDSHHIDKGAEQLPRPHNFQIRFTQFLFKNFGGFFPKFTARLAYRIFASPRWRAQHKRPDDLILSAKVVDFPFNNEIVKIYEWDTVSKDSFVHWTPLEGERGHFDPKKPKILLAHGWESRGTALRMYVRPLLEKGFKVIAFDALAHGDSTGSRNNLPTNGSTIVALVQHYGGFHAAIGHSFGCSSLIYAQAFLDKTIDFQRLVFLAVPYKTRRIMEGFFKFLQIPPKVAAAFLQHVHDLTGRSVDDMDVARLSPPSVKVGKLLLVHDQKDDVTGIDAAESIVETWENAQLLVTTGFGHFRMVKNPDVIRRVVDFIT
jgi:pimeloyl-ACP methyl ester carboxylesterase